MTDADRADFLQGMKDCVPIVLGSGAFGVLFGALAVDNGMSMYQAVLMSATIYAGASQMVGIDLFGSNVAPWLIVLSIFAVNFRHVLYSATIGPRLKSFSFAKKALAFFLLVDPQFAESERRAERGKPISFSWYLGMAIPTYCCWVTEAAIGAYFGKFIGDPTAYGLDFLLPAYFLGLVIGFRRRRNWLPVVLTSGVISVIAYKTVGSPWHVSIGAVAGVLLAAIMVKPASSEPVADYEAGDA
ncbi:MAG: branched-chain amino acid ABC transporter permease [Rhizobiaceae bacterium MnEN-MB40S]|nr:MAG: branched-chain amino acid ABC transporter permease [Rhizobiaceae bacterium MnEN-MB40S]